MNARRALILVGCMAATVVSAYPIDAYEQTGIRRLDFYRKAHSGEFPNGRRQPPGGLLGLAEVDIRGAPAVLPVADPVASAELAGFLGEDAEEYGISVIDLSDPAAVMVAEHNAERTLNVGSVGKVLIAVGVFGELARLYPEDAAERVRVLRSARVVADDIIHRDHHRVPLWDPETGKLRYRRLEEGDAGSLWESLDWMMSASSNAAAAMVMKHLIAMRHFGHEYPVAAEVLDAFWAEAGRAERGRLLAVAMDDAAAAAGIDSAVLRQGSVFTRNGKEQVLGRLSYGSAGSLARLAHGLERGTVIDRFSSREIKRLMYMTQKRIRYISHPVLADAAVYFKSGSLYSCRPEPGFVCRKYAGNRKNLLTSMAIIEAPAAERRLHYIVTVVSNVLRKNSALAHQTLAGKIHDWIAARHAARQGPDQRAEATCTEESC